MIKLPIFDLMAILHHKGLFTKYLYMGGLAGFDELVVDHCRDSKSSNKEARAFQQLNRRTKN